MLNRLLIGTALSGLLIPAWVHAESATLGPVANSASLQHPSLLAPSASSQYLPFQPRISVNGALGSDRSLAVTEGWAPLWQDDFNVFYGDIRAMVDDRNNEEYNLGFGYRALRGSQIGGLHAWLDKRDTSLGSTFYQATLGAELLTYDTDLRFNMYIPFTGTKHYVTPNTGSSTPYLGGSFILYDTNGLLAEEPQKGLDLEAGYRLPIMQAYVDAFRVYGGGYAFLGNEADDVVGLRTRAQIDVNPWLSVGARLQRDDERGTQGFLEATLRFPVESKKMIQREGVRARMDESPERDVDIVTGAKVIDSGIGKPVVNTETGIVQRVLYVDNSKAAGDGTKENPYNNLKTAEANLQAGDILYVFHGDGTTTNQNKGIVIAKDNISLIGSGVNFVYDAGKFAAGGTGADFSGTLLLGAGAAPTITNNEASVDPLTGNGVLITADNAEVAGINVNNATGNGIYMSVSQGLQFNSTKIQHVTANNNQKAGVGINTTDAGSRLDHVALSDLTTNDNVTYGTLITTSSASSNNWIGDVTLKNITANRQGVDGIRVQAAGTGSQINHIVMDNITADTNGARGAALVATTGGQINQAELSGIKAKDNISVGANIRVDAGSAIKNVSITDSQLNHNTQHGLYSQVAAGALLDGLNVSNNTMELNGGHGIFLSNTSGTINDVTLDGNTTFKNTQRGLNVTATGGTINNMAVSHHISNENSLEGMYFSATTAGAGIDVAISDSEARNNGQDGIRTLTQSTATFGLSLQGTTVTGNGTAAGTYYGVRLDMDTTGAFALDLGGGALGSTGGNRIYSNVSRDIFIDSRPGTAAATFGSIIAAKHNWWGSAAGLNQGTRATFDNGSAGANGSRIDASSPLTVDPAI